MGFLDGIEKPESATELIREAVDAAPENLSLRSTLAKLLRAAGEDEEAEQVLVEAAETFGSAAAWNLLATFYRRDN
jgi:Flp pilus assembly protein TadD